MTELEQWTHLILTDDTLRATCIKSATGEKLNLIEEEIMRVINRHVLVKVSRRKTRHGRRGFMRPCVLSIIAAKTSHD